MPFGYQPRPNVDGDLYRVVARNHGRGDLRVTLHETRAAGDAAAAAAVQAGLLVGYARLGPVEDLTEEPLDDAMSPPGR